SSASSASMSGGKESWAGSVTLPGDAGTLDYTVTIEPGADGWTGTIDIPAQGAIGVELADVVRTDSELAFRIDQAGADFSHALTGDEGSGKLEQSGMTMAGSVRRLQGEEAKQAAEGPNRPQKPEGPFPYQQWEVTYKNPKDGTRLAGTLTVPEGKGPFPAAVLITGSGPQDRNESLMGHEPFHVIADHLSRRGIAVLRSDDRGVGESQGDFSAATTHDFVGDARGAIKFLRTLKTIDSKRIGVIGHSEGGLIAPFVAEKERKLAFAVLLAGTGVPGDEILYEQVGAILRASGADEADVKKSQAAQREVMDALTRGVPEDELRKQIRALIKTQVQGLADDQIDEMVDAQVGTVTSPWFRTFLELDPRPALRRTRCPVLALNGSLDVQVLPDQNLPEIEKALRAGGNRDITIRELPGLNHLFQHATTGGMEEYAVIEETFAPEALEAMTTWIQDRMGVRAQG
ncbi:MAG: alpha/beta fold hydrolase, partial [Acidobacteriota bacterium]